MFLNSGHAWFFYFLKARIALLRNYCIGSQPDARSPPDGWSPKFPVIFETSKNGHRFSVNFDFPRNFGRDYVVK
jgi:hypothetical protein